jgi:DNA modification methylase
MAKKVKMETPRTQFLNGGLKKTLWKFDKRNGRFPSNVLCEDNVLDNSDSFSRYFSLDAWFIERIKLLPKEAQKTFPWLHVPKPSKNEKNKNLPTDPEPSQRPSGVAYNEYSSIHSEREKGNPHTTIKPLKLMMWLIILGTQEGGIVLDPFMGSGTTPLAAKMTHRPYKGIELKKEFFDTAVLRVDEVQKSIDRFL